MNDVRKFLEIEAKKYDDKWPAIAGIAEAWLCMLYEGTSSVEDFKKKVQDKIQNMPSEATESPVTHF